MNLSRAWSVWQEYASEHAEQLLILRKANPATANLARGWAAWTRLRDGLLILRKASPETVNLSRAWSVWQEYASEHAEQLLILVRPTQRPRI